MLGNSCDYVTIFKKNPISFVLHFNFGNYINKCTKNVKKENAIWDEPIKEVEP
jgi:hypothetical protein